MSTVSGTSRGTIANPTSDTRNPRDKEVETLKEEVKELNEAHRAEINRLQEENKKRIDQVHADSNGKLNEKDVQHQKEIDALRAMYNKRAYESQI